MGQASLWNVSGLRERTGEGEGTSWLFPFKYAGDGAEHSTRVNNNTINDKDRLVGV